MNKKKLALAVLIIFIAILLAVAFIYRQPKTNKLIDESLITYSNSDYGFKISYPKNLTATPIFNKYYALDNKWRANALPESKGIPVISIPVFTIDQGGVATGKPYPLSFAAEVRVGVSADPADVAACLSNDPGFGDQKTSDVTINGISFKRFEFNDAATMHYIAGYSYRTVKNNKCYVLEQIKTGASYRDDSMTAGYTDEQLDQIYHQTDAIVNSFKFVD